jgi:hypothetical protein
MRKAFYQLQAYEGQPGDTAYLAARRVTSRRQAKKWFGVYRSKYPGAMVTLNRRVILRPGTESTWAEVITTTHHHKEG